MDYWEPQVGERVLAQASDDPTQIAHPGIIVAVDPAVAWLGWAFRVQLEDTGATLPFPRQELRKAQD
jgi:phage baseplate assembly protein gpV